MVLRVTAKGPLVQIQISCTSNKHNSMISNRKISIIHCKRVIWNAVKFNRHVIYYINPMPCEIHTVTEDWSLGCDSERVSTENYPSCFVSQLWQNTQYYRKTDRFWVLTAMRPDLLTNDYLVVILRMCQHWWLNANVRTCTWGFKSPQQCW
jgi:hypothetical protein